MEGLLKKNQVLTDDFERAKERTAELNVGVVFEHKEGFNKALRQAYVLLGVAKPYAVRFDIKKDIISGILVQLEALVDMGDQLRVEEPPIEEERPTRDEADDEEEADGEDEDD